MTTICSVEGCTQTVKTRSWCKKHYSRWLRYGAIDVVNKPGPSPGGRVCDVEGCDNRHDARGFCNKHYLRWKKSGGVDLPAKKGCSVAGCPKPHEALGLCTMHYKRFTETGAVGGAAPLIDRVSARAFIDKAIAVSSDEGCVTWPFSRTNTGYAVLSGKLVARIVCRRVHGHPPTKNHEAAHSCGNGDKACISPYHLRWATPKENNADKLAHDTHNRGERNSAAKLSEADVRKIRKLQHSHSQTAIAKIFCVSRSAIWSVVARRTWSWLD